MHSSWIPQHNYSDFQVKVPFKGQRDGKLTYHLGADYFEDPDGTFVNQPKKYIDKLADTYKDVSMRIHQRAIRPLLTKMITWS